LLKIEVVPPVEEEPDDDRSRQQDRRQVLMPDPAGGVIDLKRLTRDVRRVP
jgi:hypothetical protein